MLLEKWLWPQPCTYVHTFCGLLPSHVFGDVQYTGGQFFSLGLIHFCVPGLRTVLEEVMIVLWWLVVWCRQSPSATYCTPGAKLRRDLAGRSSSPHASFLHQIPTVTDLAGVWESKESEQLSSWTQPEGKHFPKGRLFWNIIEDWIFFKKSSLYTHGKQTEL